MIPQPPPVVAAPPPAPEIPAWQIALTNAGFKFTLEPRADGTWELNLERQPVTNVAMLRGAPISGLILAETAVSDLSPLRGMPLTRLRLASTKVTDLSPLQGMPIDQLQISGTAVADISPLRGMPLRDLKMTSCTNLTDLTPLAGMTTLQSIILPPNAKNFGFLRSLTNLTRISFKYDSAIGGPAQTAAEFWAEQDRAKSP